LGAVLLLPFTQLGAAFDGSTNWRFVIALSAVHTAFLYILFYQRVRGVPVRRLAILKFGEPVVAVATEVTFYGIRPTAVQIVGMVIILLAAYEVSRQEAKEEVAASTT
jgi:drug/metabolite transporter (DMT)-like permease